MKRTNFTKLNYAIATAFLLCIAVFSAQAQSPCVLNCPDDVMVGNDPGECGAFVNIPQPTFTGACQEPAFLNVQSPVTPYNFNAFGLINTPTTIDAAPSTVGNVTMTVEFDGDHGGAFEAFVLNGPDGLQIFSNNGSGDCVDVSAMFTVDQATWNGWISNFGPDLEFVLQADADIDNLGGACTNQYQLFAMVPQPSTGAPFVNDYNGTDDASDFYPVGTTTVTFTSIDGVTGDPVTCSFDVTVQDVDGPAFTNCPNDVTINLDPGACEAIFDYGELEAIDNCEASTFSLNQNLTWPPAIGPGIACDFFALDEISYFRVFDIAPGADVIIDSIDLGMSQTVTTSPIEIRLWELNGTPSINNVTLLSETLFTPTANQTFVYLNLPITPTQVPGGTQLVVEVAATSSVFGGGNILGFDLAGETAPTFAFGCLNSLPGFFPDLTNLDNIGFPRGAIIQINGGTLPVTIEQIDNSGLTSGDFFPIGCTTQSFLATDGGGNTSLCEFDVCVKEFPNPTQSLTCNDLVSISLDNEDCAQIIGADLILEGGPYGCYEDYQIDLFFDEAKTQPVPSSPEVNANHIGQTLTVQVTDTATGVFCWGLLKVEDKQAPILNCFDVTIECDEPLPTVQDVTVPVPDGVKEYGVTPGVDVDMATNPEVSIPIAVPLPGSATVNDLDIFVDYAIMNGCTGANSIWVESPSGTRIDLWGSTNSGCGGDFPFLTCFDDESPNVLGICDDFANGTTIQPPASLGVFANLDFLDVVDGEPAGGTWTFNVSLINGMANPGFCAIFGAPADGGILNEVVLKINTPGFDPVIEACGDVDITFFDVSESFGCDSDFKEIITRTYTVTDGAGNSSTCVSQIFRERGSVADVTLPPNLDGIDAPAVDCENVCITPSCTGMPGATCDDIQFYFEDGPQVPTCGNGFKFIREWTLVDWCTQEIVKHDQIIKVEDTEAPELNCPDQALSVSVDNNCVGNISIGAIASLLGAKDNCSNPISFSWQFQGGGPVFTGLLTGLEEGLHVGTLTATDDCGNQSSCIVTLNVVDLIPPIALCDEQTSVGLGNLVYDVVPFPIGPDANAELCFDVIDDGSFDNCGIEAIRLRRMDGRLGSNSFKECVYFDCSDIGDTIMVQMRVYDRTGNFSINEPNGQISSNGFPIGAQYNECMVEVQVTDKVDPVVACPPNLNLDCWEYDPFDIQGVIFGGDNDPETPPAFLIINTFKPQQAPIVNRVGYIGDYPAATDNCQVDSVQIIVNENLDNCGEGTITRIFRAFEPLDPGATTPDFGQCIQIITVNNTDFFDICDTECWNTFAGGCLTGHSLDDGVEWPCDIELFSCGAGLTPEELDMNPAVDSFDVRPRIFDDFCDLVGVDYKDTYLTISTGCIKVIREWIVIDWCQPDPSFDLGYVTWTYTQEIKVLESEPPVFDECQDITLCNFTEDCVPLAQSTDDSPLRVNGTDDCTVDQDLNYYYQFDAFNNGTFDFNSDFPFQDGDNRVGDPPFPTPNPPFPFDTMFHDDNPDTRKVIEGKFPFGEHRILWKIEDDCGNVTSCEIIFTVQDCKKPTPVCVPLFTVIMPSSGEVPILAESFNQASYDNCTDEDDLIYAWSPDPIGFTPFGQPIYDTINVFTCDDLGTVPADIYVIDEIGNWEFCATTIQVQDPNNACGDTTVPTSMIAGAIDTEDDKPVSQVDVLTSSSNGGSVKSMTTAADGQFSFTNMVNGYNYTVEPAKDINYKNGVSTYDLVLISQHILGTAPLNSPYKIIAADANNDQKVTAFDILELRKLILGLTTDLPDNTSWRFVDASYTFPNPQNPFTPAYPEVIDINNLSADELSNDFVGVKIGDVSGDVVTLNTAGELVLNVTDQTLQAGQTYTVDFTAEDFTSMLGYQFTLDFNTEAMSFVDVTAGALNSLSTANFGLTEVTRGSIVTSWNANSTRLEDGAVVFSLTFAAKQDGRLSDLLNVSSSQLANEAYAEQGVKRVALRFNSESGSKLTGGEFALYQNEPNPFKSETLIGFNLPEATQGTLTIYDVSGKVIKRIEGDYTQGYNYVNIERSDLGAAAGVLYYQLETANHSATKKMIIIE